MYYFPVRVRILTIVYC